MVITHDSAPKIVGKYATYNSIEQLKSGCRSFTYAAKSSTGEKCFIKLPFYSREAKREVAILEELKENRNVSALLDCGNLDVVPPYGRITSYGFTSTFFECEVGPFLVLKLVPDAMNFNDFLEKYKSLHPPPRDYTFGLNDVNLSDGLVDMLMDDDEEISQEELLDLNFGILPFLYLAQSMAKIIQSVHSKGVVHLDIKPGNFVISKTDLERLVQEENDDRFSGLSNSLTLIDFGNACTLPDHKRNLNPLTYYSRGGEITRIYTAGYGAPEFIGGREVSLNMDTYSLGRTYKNLLHYTVPVSEVENIGEIKAKRINDVLKAMIEDKQNDRPPLSEVEKEISGLIEVIS
jgi:serine/threonine protein kinase